MVDIHTHVLPQLDDGAKDMEASLSLLRDAERQGIDTVFVTPHIITGLYTPTAKEIKQQQKILQDRLFQENIGITLVMGAEIGITSEVKTEELMHYTLNGGEKYLLLELPFVSYPLNCDEVIFQYQSQGFTPIIAHPERAFSVINKPDRLRAWRKKGVLFQINSKSIIGRYGKTVKNVAIKMLKDGIVDFVASDAHSSEWGFDFNDTIPVLEKLVGKAKTDELLGQNARRLILAENERVAQGV